MVFTVFPSTQTCPYVKNPPATSNALAPGSLKSLAADRHPLQLQTHNKANTQPTCQHGGAPPGFLALPIADTGYWELELESDLEWGLCNDGHEFACTLAKCPYRNCESQQGTRRVAHVHTRAPFARTQCTMCSRVSCTVQHLYRNACIGLFIKPLNLCQQIGRSKQGMQDTLVSAL